MTSSGYGSSFVLIVAMFILLSLLEHRFNKNKYKLLEMRKKLIYKSASFC